MKKVDAEDAGYQVTSLAADDLKTLRISAMLDRLSIANNSETVDD
jgi:hypothetical protein